MLSTAGLVPVAQEFCTAGRKGSCGSEFSPVSAECPSAMMPRCGSDAEVVALNGLADAVPAGTTGLVAPNQAAARKRPRTPATPRYNARRLIGRPSLALA